VNAVGVPGAKGFSGGSVRGTGNIEQQRVIRDPQRQCQGLYKKISVNSRAVELHKVRQAVADVHESIVEQLTQSVWCLEGSMF
jgi:hypothetical protein